MKAQDFSKPLKPPQYERFACALAKGVKYGKAYEMAGYKKHSSNAKRLSEHEQIRGRVAYLQGEGAKMTAIDASQVLDMLMRNAAIALGDQTYKKRFVMMPKRKGEQIKELEIEVTERDPQAANRALELIGKHLQLFPKEVVKPYDKQKEEGKDGGASGKQGRVPTYSELISEAAAASSKAAGKGNLPH